MSNVISPFEVKLDPENGYLTPEFFQSLQFECDTVFDVGVSRGTSWLYQAFPDRMFHLIDPLPGFEDILIDPPEHFECSNVGLGSSAGALTLDLRGPRSSLHSWKKSVKHPSEGRADVQVVTLDSFIEQNAPNATIGLKIDTEGHEIEVLKGLDRYRKNIEFIVCESSVRKRFEDDYNFSDLIRIAAEKGFEFYNFLSPQKPRPVHYDCIFLPRDDRRFGLGGV